jgi:hypothetical protein
MRDWQLGLNGDIAMTAACRSRHRQPAVLRLAGDARQLRHS